MKSLRYVIFGPGRVGRSMSAYLAALGHETQLLSRKHAEQAGDKCRMLIASADIVAAAIPDSALAGWAETWREAIAGKLAVHFSGALLVDGLWSYHPLYSFPREALPLETMRAVAFARQAGAPPLADAMPGANNAEFIVQDADRAYYHALAVLSGNFAAHLWNEAAKGFSGRLKVAPEMVLASYLGGLVERFRESPFDSMTGPVARRDRASVDANLKALESEPKLRALYEAFVISAWPGF